MYRRKGEDDLNGRRFEPRSGNLCLSQMGASNAGPNVGERMTTSGMAK